MFAENCIFDMYTEDDIDIIKDFMVKNRNIAPDDFGEEVVFDFLIDILNSKIRKHINRAKLIELNEQDKGNFETRKKLKEKTKTRTEEGD